MNTGARGEGGQLLEEKWSVAKESDHQIAELTQLCDEVGPLRRHLEESEKARADDKVNITF